MNERIQDLAEQTGFEFNSLGGTYTSGTLSDKLDKFAELIIRECISVVESTAPSGSMLQWEMAVGAAVFNLESHFGVEE